MGQAAYDMTEVRRRRAPQAQPKVPLRVEKGGKKRLNPVRAAMQHALPTSAWQPHCAPLMEAFVLIILPIIPAVASASSTSASVKPCFSCIYRSTAGTTPLAPQVGAVTTVPPEALCSLTA